jgi:antitoxin VapB
MGNTAKLFRSGQSQAVRLPKAFRFDGTEVDIRRDEFTGEVILKEQKSDWDSFFALAAKTDVPDDFMLDRNQPELELKDPFDGFKG